MTTSGAGSVTARVGLAGGVPSGAGDVRIWGGTRLLLRERRRRKESPRFTTPADKRDTNDTVRALSNRWIERFEVIPQNSGPGVKLSCFHSGPSGKYGNSAIEK